MKSIEIYIRQNSNGAMLNMYVPSELKDFLLESLRNGECDLSDFNANFEMSIPTSDLDNPQADPTHVRIKLSSINVNYTQEEEHQ